VDLTAILKDYNDAEEKNFECRSPVHPVMLLCCQYIYSCCLFIELFMVLSLTELCSIRIAVFVGNYGTTKCQVSHFHSKYVL